MILGTLKTKALLFLSGLVPILIGLLTLSGRRSKRLKKERDTATDAANHAADVMNADNEIDSQTTSRRADVLKEISDTGDSSIFSDPNELRKRPKD